ncbi:MAG TPA: aminotransferase class I/II-fold pyridoxal phosphate-dependent enzyme [Thermoleophilaceae bacterium]|jgi:histidinol-phosphate aminotransferase|nr:aminotransferase class I/II-fold pyridoxal phosphate-dependent enzyme [Thermoleophilaceae bacterium]
MGLLDYYRQFDDMSDAEVSERLLRKRDEERAKALAHIPLIDLSGTEWPDFPNSEVMNASIYVARGRINGYPDRYAEKLRRSLAARHAVDPERIAIGNGAAELLQSAAHALLAGGGELVTPWPSYPLYPLMAARAGGRPVAVDLQHDGIDIRRTLAAIGERTRALVICNPNDPTGTYVPAENLSALIGQVPEHVHVLLDEAFVQFQDVEDEDACLRLTDAFPRLTIFRTFSKAYGLSGLRIGYAVGSRDSTDLLTRLAPVLGVNALSQAAADYAVGLADREIAQRRSLVAQQRAQLLEELPGLGVEVAPSQANFLWMKVQRISGADLAARLERERVLVAPGGPLGADDHVRAAVRGPNETSRLLLALQRSLVPERNGDDSE